MFYLPQNSVTKRTGAWHLGGKEGGLRGGGLETMEKGYGE